MGVLTIHGKRQFVRDGFANKSRTGVQQALHHGRRAVLNAPQGHQHGLPATGGVALDVINVFGRKAQTRQRASSGMGNRAGGVRHEGVGVVPQGIGVLTHVHLTLKLTLKECSGQLLRIWLVLGQQATHTVAIGQPGHVRACGRAFRHRHLATAGKGAARWQVRQVGR